MQTFPKSSRLLKKSDFQRVYHKGIKLFGDHILVYASPTNNLSSRLGISVPKRYGKAHDRNFFKRVVRESFRTFSFPSLKYDLHVLPSSLIKNTPSQLLTIELTQLLEKLHSMQYHSSQDDGKKDAKFIR